MFVSMSPITTVVVLLGTVYIVYGEPALFGSAANVTTLNVFALFLFPYNYTRFCLICQVKLSEGNR